MSIKQRAVAAYKALTNRTMTPEQFWMTGSDMSNVFGASITSAHEKSAFVYSLINRRAGDISRVPLVFLKDPDDPTSHVGDSDEVMRLFERPFPGFDGGQAINMAAWFYLLRGEAFFVPDDDRRPAEMAPHYDPQYFDEKVTQSKRLAYWRYQEGSFHGTFMPSGLIQARMTNVARPFRGLSPLQSAAEAYRIDTYGDALQASTLRSGGERGVVFMVPEGSDVEPGTPLGDQLETRLKSRRRGPGQPKADILIPKIEALDPKLTQADIDILAHQSMSANKIGYVYRVPLFLVGDAKAPNFATAKMLVEEYWRSTILADLRVFERAFDSFFRTAYGRRTFVRFDRSKITALQADMLQQAQIAGQFHAMHIPVAELNRRFELGFEDEAIPTAHDALVSSTLAPSRALVDEWKTAPAEAGAKAAGGHSPAPGPGRLTNKEIRRKANAAVIARNRRLGVLEKGLRDDWKKAIGGYKAKAARLADELLAGLDDPRLAAPALADLLDRELRESMSEKAVDTCAGYHVKAAGEGVLAIRDLLGKVSGVDRQAYFKAPMFGKAAAEAIKRRANLVAGVVDKVFDTIRDDLWAAAEGGTLAADLAGVVLHRFNVTINRAITIGRTEVGSAYQVGRFTEMGEQGFAKHEWLTGGDELVRGLDDEFDHAECNGEVRKIGDLFPCGLAYPMEEGGDAANVINCRCETIPVVEE